MQASTCTNIVHPVGGSLYYYYLLQKWHVIWGQKWHGLVAHNNMFNSTFSSVLLKVSTCIETQPFVATSGGKYIHAWYQVWIVQMLDHELVAKGLTQCRREFWRSRVQGFTCGAIFSHGSNNDLIETQYCALGGKGSLPLHHSCEAVFLIFLAQKWAFWVLLECVIY